MDIMQTTQSLLEQLPQPIFLVKDDTVIFANRGARARGVQVNNNIYNLIAVGHQEYKNMQSGKLILTTVLSGTLYNTVVTFFDEYHMFCLESEYSVPEMRAFAVAAKVLRGPLSNIHTRMENLLPDPAIQGAPEVQAQLKEVNKNLYQLHRTIRNMSDANTLSSYSAAEVCDLVSHLSELVEKANTLLASTSRNIVFRPLSQKVHCLVNWENLERAILNLISNAAKYATGKEPIQLSMRLSINKIYISVEAECNKARDAFGSNIFSGFVREPTLDDAKNGIGLGLTIVHNVAAAHKGTLLVEQPSDSRLRFTLSIEATQPKTFTVKSPTIQIDNSGGFDNYLIELADVLSPEHFV